MQQQDTARHPKQDFQVERLAFFSDAVFAIAITLLIIEFKVPHVSETSTVDGIMHELLELKYNFAALLVSFYLIAMYWMRHHFLFRHIHNYNQRIVVANLVVLLPIIFFPFTTAFFAESFANNAVGKIAVRLFMINHIVAGLSIYALYWLAMVHHKECSFAMSAVDRLKFHDRTLFPTILFTLILLINVFHVKEEVFLGILVALTIGKKWLMRRLMKKAKLLDATIVPG